MVRRLSRMVRSATVSGAAGSSRSKRGRSAWPEQAVGGAQHLVDLMHRRRADLSCGPGLAQDIFEGGELIAQPVVAEDGTLAELGRVGHGWLPIECGRG